MSWPKIFAIVLSIIGLVIVCLTFQVLAAAFLGVLIALSLNGPAAWIRTRWKMPAWAATLMTMLLVLTVVAGLWFVIGPPLMGQADELGRKLPVAVEKSVEWLKEHKWGRTAVEELESFLGMSPQRLDSQGLANDGHEVLRQDHTLDSPPRQLLVADGQAYAAQDRLDRSNGSANDIGNGDSAEDVKSVVLPILHNFAMMLSVTVWTLMLLLVSFVVTLYVAFDPDVYRRGILWLIPAEHEEVATLTMARMCVALRWWMLGRLCSMLAVGLLTSLGMWLIGMPAPLALGALAGILSFVPNIGPIIASVTGLLLAVPEGPWMVLAALTVYVVAEVAESHLLNPLVAQYMVTTPPAFLIVVQVMMAVLAGAWGVLIAPPLFVVVMVLIQQLYVREYIKKPIEVLGSDDDETPGEEQTSTANST